MTTQEEASNMHSPDTRAPSPGCAPLPPAQLTALGLAARIAVLEARVVLAGRLAAHEPLASLESDLGPVAERVLAPLRNVLVDLAPDSGLAAAYLAASAMLRECLMGDLRGARQLAAMASPPAPGRADT